MDKKTIKNIVIAVVVIGGIFLGLTFFGGGTQDDLLVSSSEESVSPVVAELFSILRNLSELKIDTAIFEDEAFRSLIDHSVTLTSQPQGRENPFLPIGR